MLFFGESRKTKEDSWNDLKWLRNQRILPSIRCTFVMGWPWRKVTRCIKIPFPYEQRKKTFRNNWTQFPFGGRKLCANNDEVRSCRHSKNESCANAHTRMSAVCIYIFYLRRFSLPRRKNAENIKVNVMIRYDEQEQEGKKKKRSTRAAPLHGSVWEQYQRQQLYTMPTTANWLLRQQQHCVHKSTSQSSWISDMENAKKNGFIDSVEVPAYAPRRKRTARVCVRVNRENHMEPYSRIYSHITSKYWCIEPSRAFTHRIYCFVLTMSESLVGVTLLFSCAVLFALSVLCATAQPTNYPLQSESTQKNKMEFTCVHWPLVRCLWGREKRTKTKTTRIHFIHSLWMTNRRMCVHNLIKAKVNIDGWRIVVADDDRITVRRSNKNLILEPPQFISERVSFA